MNGIDQKRKKNEISEYIIDPDVLKEISRGLSDYKSDEKKKVYLHNKLVSKFGEDYKNIVDCRGDTLVHVSAALGHFDLCQFILESGFDINKRGEEGVTPLHELVYAYQIHIARKCRGEEVDPNAEYLKLFQLFLDKGANISISDNYGYTVGEIMIIHDNIDMQHKVFNLAGGSSLNARKKSDVTASNTDQKVSDHSAEAGSDKKAPKPSSESFAFLGGMRDANTNNTKKFRMPHIQDFARFRFIEELSELSSKNLGKEKKKQPVRYGDIVKLLFEELIEKKENLSAKNFIKLLDEEIIRVVKDLRKEKKNQPTPEVIVKILSEELIKEKENPSGVDVFEKVFEEIRKLEQDPSEKDAVSSKIFAMRVNCAANCKDSYSL